MLLSENPLLCIEDETFELLTESHVISWKPTGLINQGTHIEYLESNRKSEIEPYRKPLTPFHCDGVNELFSRLSDRPNQNQGSEFGPNSPRGQPDTKLSIEEIKDETSVIFTSEITSKR